MKLLSFTAKCLFATALAFSVTAVASAQDGLIVKAQSGTTTAISFSNVHKLNFVNETMTVVNAAGADGQSFSLATTHSIVFGEVAVSGINDKAFNPLVKVYPTLTKDFIYVDNANLGARAVVYSIAGSRVIDVKMSDSNNAINVTTLQAGVYILKVDGATFKFNKQ